MIPGSELTQLSMIKIIIVMMVINSSSSDYLVIKINHQIMSSNCEENLFELISVIG